MAHDTPLKKENWDMPDPNQPKMPKYEYQKDDIRSFTVGYGETQANDKKAKATCENQSVNLKIF